MTEKNLIRPTRRTIATGMAATAAAACGGGGGGDSGGSSPPPGTGSSPPPSGSSATATFPLSAPSGSRYLVGANGAPYLMQGDAGWYVMSHASREDAVTYLADRASRKFNAIAALLIDPDGSNAPANFYGDRPFTGALFGTPNEAYFAHADYVITQAAQRGILVLLSPSWLGTGNNEEGFYDVLVSAGETVVRAYGRYLGNRYRNSNNIMWMQGGDRNTTNLNVVRWLAEGIREVDPNKLHTAHCERNTGALDIYAGEAWLKVNNSYTQNDNVVALCRAQYQKSQALPFFLVEGYYEGQHNTSVVDMRLQAYQSLLSGACGQHFGNFPVYELRSGFAGSLSSPGAQSMTIVWNLFSALRWQLLVPDFNNTFLTGGVGSAGVDQAAAAVASNGSFGLVYAPSPRTLTVNLSRLSGPNMRARWYNPATGDFSSAAAGNPAANGSMNFSTPSTNTDWALLLESV